MSGTLETRVPHRPSAGFPHTHECGAKDPNRPASDDSYGEKPQIVPASCDPVQVRDPHWIATSAE